MLRLLHTSDWHLGHTLRGEVSREYEHAQFLAWLVALIAREAPDVTLVTGDIFDSGTPPASAERMWFEVLAAARRARPGMDIVVIAGNHDSPGRLGASSAILRELGIVVIGGLPRRADGEIDLDRVLVPVGGGRGLVAAVPFLRPIDLPIGVEDPLAAVYGEVLAGARARRRPGQALIATGHLYVAGADAKYLSERRVAIGGQEAAPARLFPADLDYVALGHMHRAQRVGRETMRYAGAPIALCCDERHYQHQVVIVEIGDGGACEVRPVLIPRAVEILRIGPAMLGEVVAEIAALPPAICEDDPARPLLEVVVTLTRPEPRLRTTIELALEGKRARLVRLVDVPTGDGKALADHVGVVPRLAELDPRDVFARCWARQHVEPPGPEVRAAFERLLVSVSGDGGP